MLSSLLSTEIQSGTASTIWNTFVWITCQYYRTRNFFVLLDRKTVPVEDSRQPKILNLAKFSGGNPVEVSIQFGAPSKLFASAIFGERTVYIIRWVDIDCFKILPPLNWGWLKRNNKGYIAIYNKGYKAQGNKTNLKNIPLMTIRGTK